MIAQANAVGAKKLSLGFFPSARSARALLLFWALGEEAGALWGQPVETKAHAETTRAGDVGDRRCGGEAAPRAPLFLEACARLSGLLPARRP